MFRNIKKILDLVARWSAVRRGILVIGEKSIIKARSMQLKVGSCVTIGPNSNIACNIIADRVGAKFEIGGKTFIGNSTLVAAEKIEIGNDVLISWGGTIVDHDSHSIDFRNRKDDVLDWANGNKNWEHVKISPVKICDKVWIGFGVIILKGVTVGEGAVIAAGSVVTHDVEPWTVVAGNPAKFIKLIARD